MITAKQPLWGSGTHLTIQACWENDFKAIPSGFLRLQQFIVQGDPHLCLQHTLLNTSCQKILLWEGERRGENGLTRGSTTSALAWDVLIKCRITTQDGPGLVPHCPLPHPRSPSIYMVPLFPIASHRPQAWAGSDPAAPPSAPWLLPSSQRTARQSLTLATSQLRALSKERLFYCQHSIVQSFPLTPKLIALILKSLCRAGGANKQEEDRERGVLRSQHKRLLSPFSLPARFIWANSWMQLIRLCPSLCYAKWEALLPLLAGVPGSLACRAGRRHRRMPGDAPSWVTHCPVSSRTALLPGPWHPDTQLVCRGDCSCASTSLNNDIFKLAPTEVFAFCIHAPQECFLLIDLTQPGIFLKYFTVSWTCFQEDFCSL